MKILAIYPALSFEFNSCVAAVPLEMKNRGNEVIILTAQNAGLKGNGILPRYEETYGLKIYRPFLSTKEMISRNIQVTDEMKMIIMDFAPDIILCSLHLNIFLALKLQKIVNSPIALIVENAVNRSDLVAMRQRTWTRLPALILGKIFWPYLCKKCEAIITADPRDKGHLEKLSYFGTPIFYVPWSFQIIHKIEQRPLEKKEKRAIHIGSLRYAKNSHELLETIPRILKNPNIDYFLLIGQEIGVSIVEPLKKICGDRLVYKKNVSNKEAYELINESLFGYTPIKFGGWNFIGNSWALRTPLVVTHNVFEFTHLKDALVANKSSIDRDIDILFKDKTLYKNLQENGYKRYLGHTADKVSLAYLDIFRKSIKKRIIKNEK